MCPALDGYSIGCRSKIREVILDRKGRTLVDSVTDGRIVDETDARKI
jgi:hypothetical protein